ncbi:MAG: heat-inducible transcriptional repressor HrcA [Chloroflexota bacterium]
MERLTERQNRILALVVRNYTETAQPVGSKLLVEHYRLDMSSATVRNEMLELTEKGYLRQPHTSAGRVPTEKGYRYFVRQLMVQTDLPSATQRMIVHQFHQAKDDIEEWMRLAVSVLAHQSQAAALVTAPHPHQVLFKHLSLIGTSGRQVLMVIVLMGGEVRQQLLFLPEPVSQDRLSVTAERMTVQCEGLNADAIASIPDNFDNLEQDILRLTVEEMRRSSLGGEIYRDGLANILAEPEFSETDAARRALRILEERPLLEDLLTRAVVSPKIGGVQVLIGGEGAWDELRECSIVLTRYGSPNILTGILGVLGPTRMPYGQTISTVRFVAGVLSDLVSDMYGIGA